MIFLPAFSLDIAEVFILSFYLILIENYFVKKLLPNLA